ncbi:MAG: hypothetical protein WCF24_04895 [Acidimicrobiales bacterium]
MQLKENVRGPHRPNLALRWALGVTLVVAGVATLAAPAASAANRGAPARLDSAARFHVTGIVSGVSANSVQLFVERGVVAGHSARHQLLTVQLGHVRIREVTAGKGHARFSAGSFAIGEVARCSGEVSADGSSADLEAESATVSTDTPATALVGTVYETGGSLVIVDRTVFGRWDEMSSFVQPVIVDDTNATVTLDGAAAMASQIAAGQTVIVLGTDDNDIVLAASIDAFTTPPTIATGILQTVSGTTLAITPFGGRFLPLSLSQAGNNNVSDSFGPFLVDASTATIVLNGVSGAAVSELTPGDAIIAVGPPGTSPLVATTVFAFNQSDVAPLFFVRHHHLGFQNGQGGQWWSGQQSGKGDRGSNSQGADG